MKIRENALIPVGSALACLLIACSFSGAVARVALAGAEFDGWSDRNGSSGRDLRAGSDRFSGLDPGTGDYRRHMSSGRARVLERKGPAGARGSEHG